MQDVDLQHYRESETLPFLPQGTQKSSTAKLNLVVAREYESYEPVTPGKSSDILLNTSITCDRKIQALAQIVPLEWFGFSDEIDEDLKLYYVLYVTSLSF